MYRLNTTSRYRIGREVMRTTSILIGLCVVVAAATAWAQQVNLAPDQTIGALDPDSIPNDESSLHCIGLRWLIRGDANGNATASVAFRRAGAGQWLPAMPLRRVESEALEDRKPPAGVTILAGSIFGLMPGTEYKVKLTLTDPDGGSGEQIISRTTWSEPVAPRPKAVIHVAPGRGGGAGTKDRPFRGLAEAAEHASPGVLLLLEPGVYRGPLRAVNNGTADAPIVWRGSSEGESVINGPANGTAIDARNRKHVYFERLVIRGARQAMAVDGAEFLVIRRCKMTDVDNGISDDAQAHRLFISDNVIEGKLPYGQKNQGEVRGIELSGTGHVICYNRISRFRDAIDTRKPWPVRDIDIHNNDCSDCEDDGIELDFSEHNVRVYDNRLTNCHVGISFQPSRGGPNYAIRNILYNIQSEAFKLHLTPTNRKAPDWKIGPHRTSGGVILHNTVIKKGTALQVWSNEGPANYFYARNNLLVGIGGYWSIDIMPPMRHADFDYNAYVSDGAKKFANWNGQKYDTIDQFRQGTGMETHGLAISSFAGVFDGSVTVPADSKVAEEISRNRPELIATSPAVDAGELLPNINDDFKGEAPDIGAWELGGPRPHYGPRPE